MDYALRTITPPAIEPVTVDEVKLHTHISHAVEDTLLPSWIRTARELAEAYQRRCYIAQELEMSFDEFPEMPVCFPRGPIISVRSVKVYDIENVETVLFEDGTNPITTTEEPGDTGADYLQVDTGGEPGRIGFVFGRVWPSIVLRPMSGLKIRFVAGYGIHAADVPAPVRDAIMLYCTFRYENRAGETEAPKQFYDLLRNDRLFIAGDCDE